MNTLMGFNDWSSVIPAPYSAGGRGRRPKDNLEVAHRVYMTMKAHGFRGVFQLTDIKQNIGHDKYASIEDKMATFANRMPLQITLKAGCGLGKGTVSIEVVLQGFTKDPNGYPVIKVDLPDLKSERQVYKGSVVA